jgi:hypothetical protein
LDLLPKTNFHVFLCLCSSSPFLFPIYMLGLINHSWKRFAIFSLVNCNWKRQNSLTCEGGWEEIQIRLGFMSIYAIVMCSYNTKLAYFHPFPIYLFILHFSVEQ